MVAYVGIAPIVGGFADRLPRRRLLIALDVGACWFCHLLAVRIRNLADIHPDFSVERPAQQALRRPFKRRFRIFCLTRRNTRGRCRLSRLAYDLENLLSPTLAAAVLLLVSYDALFAANCVAFLASAFLVFSVILPAPKQQERVAGVWHNLTYGIRTYLNTPRLRGLLALSLAVAAARCHGDRQHCGLRPRSAGWDGERYRAGIRCGRGRGRCSSPFFCRVSLIISLTGQSCLLVACCLEVACFSASQYRAFRRFFQFGLSLGPARRSFRRQPGDFSDVRPTKRIGQRYIPRSLRYRTGVGWSPTRWPGGLGTAFDPSTAFTVLAIVALIATVTALVQWPAYDPVELEHLHSTMEHEHLHVHDEHHQHMHEGWEGPEPHRHPHEHADVRHSHAYVIDLHHPVWPSA